jgi:hypothetical protein
LFGDGEVPAAMRAERLAGGHFGRGGAVGAGDAGHVGSKSISGEGYGGVAECSEVFARK